MWPWETCNVCFINSTSLTQSYCITQGDLGVPGAPGEPGYPGIPGTQGLKVSIFSQFYINCIFFWKCFSYKRSLFYKILSLNISLLLDNSWMHLKQYVHPENFLLKDKALDVKAFVVSWMDECQVPTKLLHHSPLKQGRGKKSRK